MNTIFHRDEYTKSVTLRVVLAFTPDEQQALSYQNNLHMQCLQRLWVSLGFWRSEKKFSSLDFSKFLEPGLFIEGFTPAAADAFERDFQNTHEPRIAKTLEGLVQQWKRDVYKAQTAARDNQFSGGISSAPIIDMTPSAFPALSAPPTMPIGTPPLYQPPQLATGIYPPPPLHPTFERPTFYAGAPAYRYTQIDGGAFVAYKLDPPRGQPPALPRMAFNFRPFEGADDYTVKMDLTLSYEERQYLAHQGHDEEILDSELVFGPKEMADLQVVMANEMAAAFDPHTRAALALEHKSLLDFARTEKHDLTLEYYLAFPFERHFTSRREATQYQDMLKRKVISKIQGWLKQYYNEETE